MQTKIQSFGESVLNVLIGYGIAVLSQIIIFPAFDIHIPMEQNFLIAMWFTFISLVRSYFVRRFFNLVHRKQEGVK